MKRLIYMLLLFVVLGHTVFAQEQKAEPLEVRLLDGFFPLGADWYRAQKDAWQVELKKDKRNERHGRIIGLLVMLNIKRQS